MTKSLRKLESFILGVGDVINPLGSYSAYIRPKQGDRINDARALNGAFVVVGRGLEKNANKAIGGIGGQTYQRQRKRQEQRADCFAD